VKAGSLFLGVFAQALADVFRPKHAASVVGRDAFAARLILSRVRSRNEGLEMASPYYLISHPLDGGTPADMVLFVKPKIYFKNGGPAERGRTNSLGSTVVAMGERGVQALRNAERNGRGLCFQRDLGALRLRIAEAAD
jgi:hypothetical protein